MSSATPNSQNTTPDSTYNSISYLSTRQVLSPTVGFYLRKLIRRNFDQLKLDRSGRSLLADGWGDLDRLLIMHHNHNEAAIQTAIQQLEHLTRAHQVLSSQGATFPEELRETERSIFALLGYQLQRQTDRGNILVVDDTPANVRILTDTLMHHGYEICSAMSGERALEIVKNFVPDLILLDVMMPEMDGYTLCQQLKERAETHDIPVMFLSAIDTQNDKIKAFQVGGVDYITKPFHLEEVIARVGQQIDRRNLQKRLEQQNFRLHAEIQNYKQLEERYRSIFDNAIDGMFQSTPEGQFITANTSLAKMYGYVSVEELCTSISDISQQLYVRPDRRSDFMKTVLRNGDIVDFGDGSIGERCPKQSDVL